MRTHNICFYGEISKIIPKLSSNTLLICSTGNDVSFISFALIELAEVYTQSYRSGFRMKWGLERTYDFQFNV